MRKALLHLKKCDPVLADIIERVGPYRMDHTEPNFQSLARSIVYQQLSGKAAGTIYGRLIAASSDPLTPAGILRLSPEEMRALGLSQQKSAYLRDLAERTAAAEINFEQLAGLTDDEIVQQLTKVKGIGVWTVHMFLMFALRRPDVLPTGDLGIRNAIQKAYRLRKPPKPEQIRKIGRRWQPYSSVASWYLWRSLDEE